MFVRLNKPINQGQILNAILEWSNLLSEEKYEDAYKYTEHDPYYAWTPELMKEVIQGGGYLLDGSETVLYKVSDWKNAKILNNSNPYKELSIYDEPLKHFNSDYNIIGDFHYDLPLNGNWSDVSSIFRILESTNFVTIELNDIHVL